MIESKNASLDKIINRSAPKNQEEFNELLASLLQWLLNNSLFDQKTPYDRLKFFFFILEKNNKTREMLNNAFKSFLCNIDLFNLYSTAGIALHSSLTNEFFDRFFSKFSLYHTNSSDLAHHLSHIISEPSQIEWINNIEEPYILKIHSLLSHGYEKNFLINNLNESITYLISQFAAEGLDPKLQKRLFREKVSTSVFFYVNAKWSALLRAEELGQTEALLAIQNEFLELLNICQHKIQTVPELYKTKGVDSDIVFKIEKIKSLLQRINALYNLKYSRFSNEEKQYFYFSILSSFIDQNKILNFASNSFTVVAKQIISINASKASDYIAKNREHFINLFKMAIGGGVLTALTVILKFLITKSGVTGFWHGFFQMLNYASSFLLIHYLHFTLATKQPTSTASHLADLMSSETKLSNLSKIIPEVKSILKSQFLSVLGNLIAVIPTVILFAYSYLMIFGEHFLDQEKSLYTLNSLKLFSMVPVYAIFTGVILWSTGLFAGWINNFFIFYELDKIFFKKIKSEASSIVSPVLSNLFLGFFLGVLPEIFKFLKVPLDVRHITLSTGTLFLALPVIGFANVSYLEYLNITLGLFVIAFFNIATSFYLTIKLSFKASSVSKERQFLIYKNLFKSFFVKD